ncbi:carbohydrate binding family 6 [Diplodia corticola]|uniref:Carbohydrate binding family 6 n=1 Tax=Diplodia corticola TaxID=236234 RepID=A0A1J9SJI9_9PEZI|nr:carbohydrate binding family 6 [Diplodia corticola]OJD39765.1 carbohydrate binding family 6 [Diplodia corticola]
MRSPIRFACLGLLAVGLTSALPFEAVNSQSNDARAPAKSRSYAVVNVDGTSNADGGSNAQELHRRAPAKSYSVVNVDGGSPTTSEAPSSVTLTKTVDKPTTVSPTETVIHTKDTTLVVTETRTPAPSVTQTVVYTTTIFASSTATETESTTSTTTIPPSVVTLPPSVITVTATQSDTTSYYDNGMWHTSYAVKTFTTTTPS